MKQNKSTEIFKIRAVYNQINFSYGNSQSLQNKRAIKWVLLIRRTIDQLTNI